MEERIEVLENDLVYLYKKDIENRAAITKILENNEKILESFVYKNEEITKKLSLAFNFIEHMCDPETDMPDFLMKNAIDIYNCDKNLFCKMIAKHDDMTKSCVEIFKLLFFDISYEELDAILEDASMYNKNGDVYSKWYKLNFLYNLVLQGYSLTNDTSGFPFEYQLNDEKKKKLDNDNYKNMFLQKMYIIFNDTDVSSCRVPYNSKEQFLKNQIFKICYNQARNLMT